MTRPNLTTLFALPAFGLVERRLTALERFRRRPGAVYKADEPRKAERMIRDEGALSALETAARRLDRAISLLETRLDGKTATAKAEVDGLFDLDRAKLASELDAARGRERELQAAGQEAAKALDQAIHEIRAALSQRQGA